MTWSDGIPLTTSIEKWCESQGQTAINFLDYSSNFCILSYKHFNV